MRYIEIHSFIYFKVKWRLPVYLMCFVNSSDSMTSDPATTVSVSVYTLIHERSCDRGAAQRNITTSADLRPVLSRQLKATAKSVTGPTHCTWSAPRSRPRPLPAVLIGRDCWHRVRKPLKIHSELVLLIWPVLWTADLSISWPSVESVSEGWPWNSFCKFEGWPSHVRQNLIRPKTFEVS